MGDEFRSGKPRKCLLVPLLCYPSVERMLEENENAEISSHAQEKPRVEKFPVPQTLLPPICWLSMSEVKNIFHFLPGKDLATAALLSKRLRSSKCAAAAIARVTIKPCLPHCILTSAEALCHIVFSSNIDNPVWSWFLS